MREVTNKIRYRFVGLSLFLGAIFLGLSFLVNKDIFRTLDYDILTYFQSVFDRLVDLPFSFITLSGSSEITLFTTAMIFLIVYLKKKSFFTGIFLIFLIYIFELAGKILIFHPKPPAIFNRYALDIIFPSSFVVQTAYSFPSGHMSRVSFLVTIILFLFLFFTKNKRHKLIVLIFSACYLILVFVSRIYLAEHWLSDVLGGLLLGTSIASMAIAFW